MRSSKIFLALAVCFTLFITSCSKDDPGILEEETAEKATLSFGTILNDLVSSKAAFKQEMSIPGCSDDAPATVEVILSLGGTNVVGDVGAPVSISVNPTPYDYDNDGEDEYFTDESADLELEPGDYVLEYFQVLDADGDVLWAAPIDTGSPGDFSGLVDSPLPMEISLGAGVKNYVPVEVVCYDERFVEEYGYLFFDIENSEAIEFCLFGNVCDENGRHAPANFRFDVWVYSGDPANPQGAPLFDANDPYINNVGVNEDGEAYADPLCLFLPDTNGEDVYYGEVYLMENGTSTLIREGQFTDADVTGLFDGAEYTDYYHFREGCGGEDSPDIFQEADGGNGNECDPGDPDPECEAQRIFERNYFSIQDEVFTGESLPTPNSESLEILEITGNTNVLAGGSNFIEVTATSNTTELIVGVQGQAGYFTIPLDENQGDPTSGVIFDLLLLIGQQAADTFTLVFSPSDGEGNYGPYETLIVTRQEAGTGLLQVSLSWDQPNDVDLHLIEPDGERIFYGNSTSSSGGELDVDSNAGCGIDGINNENIYYDEDEVMTGEYRVQVDLWSNCNVPESTDYTVVAYYDGQRLAVSSGANPAVGEFNPGDTELETVMTFNIPNSATAGSTARKPLEANKTSQARTIYKFVHDKENKVFESFNKKAE